MSRSKGKNTAIDYLFEDPEIPSQKYALVSIVGPHMPQKCDVWGLKIRGTADSINSAKSLCKRLLNIDNNYDIYTVEVGKFFPLNVDPLQIKNIEYQNEHLNALIKNYLEDRDNANDLWNQRKAELIQEAIREGKNQKELENKPEHPMALLNRIKNYEQKITETEELLKSLQEDLNQAQEKFDQIPELDKSIVLEQYNSMINQNQTENTTDPIENTTDPIENTTDPIENTADPIESTTDPTETTSENNHANAFVTKPITVNEKEFVEDIISKIDVLENELRNLETFRSSISEDISSKGYITVSEKISKITKEIQEYRSKLNDKNLINDYINKNYPDPKIHLD